MISQKRAVVLVASLSLLVCILALSLLNNDHRLLVTLEGNHKHRQLSTSFADMIVVFLDMDGVLAVWPVHDDDDDDDAVDDRYDSYFDDNDDNDDFIVLDKPLHHYCNRPVPSRTLEAFSSLLEAIPEDQRKVVLSSAWRLSHECRQTTLQYLEAYGAANGGVLANFKEFDGRTGDYHKKRHVEIEHWLDKHNRMEEIAAWVVLDDGAYKGKPSALFMDHVVTPGRHIGLTDEDVDRAIEIIQKQLDEE